MNILTYIEYNSYEKFVIYITYNTNYKKSYTLPVNN